MKKGLASILSVVLLLPFLTIQNVSAKSNYKPQANIAYESSFFETFAVSETTATQTLQSLISRYPNGSKPGTVNAYGTSFNLNDCYGFAKYVFNTVFGVYAGWNYNGDVPNYPSIIGRVDSLNKGSYSESGIKSLINSARPGDIIQADVGWGSNSGLQHTMVFVTKDSNGFTVFDSNGDGDGRINTRYYNYSSWQGNGANRISLLSALPAYYPLTPPDTTPPVISNVKITNLTTLGYTVTCSVTDNSGISRVQFPTWTTYKYQDDIAANWTVNPAVSGTKNGNTYTFRVNDSDHFHEKGEYVTHIYAYDLNGNESNYRLTCNVENKFEIVKSGVWNGSTYLVFNDNVTWQSAKTYCEKLGGHLSTISSDSENSFVKALIKSQGRFGYFLGANTFEKEFSWKWVTGEPFSYSHWANGEPNGRGTDNILEILDNGFWYDIPSNIASRGFVCEIPSSPYSLKLNASEILLPEGLSLQLTYSVSPINFSSVGLKWSSNNAKIATVDNKGMVTGHNPGSTEIKCELAGKTTTCKITVLSKDITPPNKIPVKGIKLNYQNITLNKNGSLKLKSSITPSNASNKSVNWASSNKKIVTVDKNGTVKALNNGKATITAITKDGKKAAKCIIHVGNKVSRISLNRKNISISNGKTFKLKAAFLPKDAANKTVLWKSQNIKIAKVDKNGLVKGIGPGKTVLIATSQDGRKIARCNVTVKKK